jgi:hypothetical protein
MSNIPIDARVQIGWEFVEALSAYGIGIESAILQPVANDGKR